MKRSGCGFSESLVPGTDRSGRDKIVGFLIHRGPPEALAEEGKSSIHSRVTGESDRMGPLEDIRTDRVRDKQTIIAIGTWIGFVPLSLKYAGLYHPGN